MAIMTNVKNFANVKWIGCKQYHNITNSDICISKYSDGRLSITFRNDCWKKLASGGACARIEFALFNDDIMVFRTDKNGYKLSTSGETTSHISFSTKTMDAELKDKLFMFLGNYPLEYDERFKLWYISKSSRYDV